LSRAFRGPDAIARQDTATHWTPAYMISLARGLIEIMARHPGAAWSPAPPKKAQLRHL